MNFPSRRKIHIYSRAFRGLFKTTAEIQQLYKKVQTMIHVHDYFFSRTTFLFRRQFKLKQKHTLFWARIIMILRKI